MAPRPPLVVLVEGESDRAAALVLCERLGLRIGDGAVVAMGGAMSVGRFASEAREAGIRAIGLCDVGEVRFFARVLDEYLVCDPDLEGEFIRALGVEGVERVIAREGDLPALRTFQNQPFQRGRPVEDQLRRFLGTMSGRKIRYGAALAEAVDLTRLPAALADLMSAMSR